MKVCLRLTLALSLLFVCASFGLSQSTAQVLSDKTTAEDASSDTDDKNKQKTAAKTEEKPVAEAAGDPLVRLLVSKGVLSAADAAVIGAVSAAEQRDKLATLLVQKGLISISEFESVKAVPANSISVIPAVATSPSSVAAEKIIPSSEARPTTNAVAQAQAATVVPAVAPIRVLQLEGTKRDGLLPDIKLGSGAKVKFYGFYKVAVVHDTSSPTGNDFPLPGFLNDSGPNGSPEFHLKARSLRIGANFEWLDLLPKVTLTGRAEIDFEGDFPRANSRNIASIRSNQPNLRLAWMRVDYAQNDRLGWHVLFGQDWTPFASSTNPQTIETTGFHLGYGNIYQRLPQVRFGVNYLLAKNRNVRFQPEVAIALPLVGNLPLNVADQLGFGERQGVDSQRPELQGRFVLQFQLDKAPGVVPAQLIASWMQSQRKAIVTRENLTTAVNANAGLTAAQRTAILSSFVGGEEVESNRYGWTVEAQLPTRYFTVVSKYYNGQDLRGYFAGQLFSIFNDTFGLTNTTNVLSIDGSSTTVVGFLNGTPTFAEQRGIRQQGGFVNIGFPLSRWFNVDPKSRLAGFQAYLHYGYEEAKPRDVRRLNGTTLNPVGQFAQSLGANRARSDVFMGSLHYRVNSFVTFAYEQSYFRTRAANEAGALPLFRGIPSRVTHNIRSEFASIFTF